MAQNLYNPKTVAIVGYGRFGKTLIRLFGDDFKISVYTRSEIKEKLSTNTTILTSIEDIYKSEVVFYCVPISSFKEVIKFHKKYFKDNLLIDVLSVKVHPLHVFKEELSGTNARAILTHPMFGPDSSKDGFEFLPIIMSNHSANQDEYVFWKKYFTNKKLKIVEMTPKDHDKYAANSQGVTHFVGRLLEDFGLDPTPIDSVGAKRLYDLMTHVSNDTWQLFLDLQTYNPYTKEMRVKIGESYDKIYNKLLPERTDKNNAIYGIQGGVGSFNEEALNVFLEKNEIKNASIEYLYTTARVLEELHRGNIDYGIFAVSNTIGGIVAETINVLGSYKFKIIEEVTINIRHFLQKRKETDLDEIDTIMAHPQVFKQCAKTLSRHYKKYKLVVGEGDLIDHARVAKAMHENELPKNIAVLGPKILSKIYGFDIVAENLQDREDNRTTFLVVER